ncbi:MAG: NUDIX domain-containing protein [Bdellovibrionales bacterium]
MSRENGIHKIEVHVAGFCFDLEREDGPRCLIAKRNPDRKICPGVWECGGGQMKAGESFSEALARQIYEEFGLEIAILFPFGEYFISTETGGIPGMKFVCSVEGEREVTLDKQEHSEYVWVSEADLDKYEFIPGVGDEIAESFKILAEC